MWYCIIETDDGLTVVEFGLTQTAEQAAAARGGELIDAGPYSTYEAAEDALASAQESLHADATSDTPGTSVSGGSEERR